MVLQGKDNFEIDVMSFPVIYYTSRYQFQFWRNGSMNMGSALAKIPISFKSHIFEDISNQHNHDNVKFIVHFILQVIKFDLEMIVLFWFDHSNPHEPSYQWVSFFSIWNKNLVSMATHINKGTHSGFKTFFLHSKCGSF